MSQPYTHFIGKTALLERTLLYKAGSIVRRLQDNRKAEIPVRERRWLLTGPPGVGKTELSWLLCRALCGLPQVRAGETFAVTHPEIEHRNGSGIGVDVVRDWLYHGNYYPMDSLVSVKFIDEIDGVSEQAMTDLRTYLDTLPDWRVFIATTNEQVEDLQPQLQSRFQVFYFDAIPADALRSHLSGKFPDLPPAAIESVIAGCSGNVRAAESDCQTHLDARLAMAA